MKAFLNLFLSGSVALVAACGQSEHQNEMASDTTHILDKQMSHSATPSPSPAGQDGMGQTLQFQPYEESYGKQSSRVSIGSDTTGKRPHDGYPMRSANVVNSTDTTAKPSGEGLPIRPRD